MKVMVIVKATKESEAGEMPDDRMFAAMTKYNEELVKAGIMLAGDGLQPSAKGKRIKFSGGKRTVVLRREEGPARLAQHRRDVAHIGGRHGQARGHRLHHRERHLLGIGGEREEVHRAIGGGRVGHVAGEAGDAAEAELGGERTERHPPAQRVPGRHTGAISSRARCFGSSAIRTSPAWRAAAIASR